MIVKVKACAVQGIEGHIVDVEVDFNPRSALPSFTIVGLPDAGVRESRDRVRSAIRNSNYTTSQRLHKKRGQGNESNSAMPLGQKQQGNEEHVSGLQFPNKTYVVNLSPADLPKQGPAYDLGIAIGVLAATDQAPMGALEKSLFVGELSLDGSVRHVKGVMAMAMAAAAQGLETIFVPADDANEAALVENITVIPVASLGQLIEHLYNLQPIPRHTIDLSALDADESLPAGLTNFADIKGQETAKRALEIAAAGNHNLRMSGPPGSGKTLLARAIPGILPRLSLAEALEVTRIYSVADMLPLDQPLMRLRPFRAPHHTISQAGMVGGGSVPRPGEVTLAHRGVLFLDEVNEQGQHTLEALRQPIEDRIVTISRAKGSLTFPANFLLVMAHNPCPCGYFGDSLRACTCTPTMIARYQAKLSGPLLDRIDIHLDVPRVQFDKLLNPARAETSAEVRHRVESARARQTERLQGTGLFANADMNVSEIQALCIMTADATQMFNIAIRRMNLSARSYHRVLKLSRTIADLAESELIEIAHVAEAIQYRPKLGDA